MYLYVLFNVVMWEIALQAYVDKGGPDQSAHLQRADEDLIIVWTSQSHKQ